MACIESVVFEYFVAFPRTLEKNLGGEEEMGRIIGYLIVLGILVGIIVAAEVNAALGIIVGVAIAVGVPIVLNLLFRKIDDVTEKIAERILISCHSLGRKV